MKKVDKAKFARELTSIVNSILLNFSSLEDNGRLIKTVNYSHITQEVIPAYIAEAIRDKQIFEED